MNHRHRVLTALRHQEPDRVVPIDLGGTVDSTIMAVAYKRLREHLGLSAGSTRVADVYQHTALVEEDVRQALGVDVRVVFCCTPTALPRRSSPTSSRWGWIY
jgi:hypothetical protein